MYTFVCIHFQNYHFELFCNNLYLQVRVKEALIHDKKLIFFGKFKIPGCQIFQSRQLRQKESAQNT